jgi:hypothetical protein
VNPLDKRSERAPPLGKNVPGGKKYPANFAGPARSAGQNLPLNAGSPYRSRIFINLQILPTGKFVARRLLFVWADAQRVRGPEGPASDVLKTRSLAKCRIFPF